MDEDFVIIEQKKYKKGKFLWRKRWDNKRELIVKKEYNSTDGKQDNLHIQPITYHNEKGLIIKMKFDCGSYTIYDYDKNDNLIEMTHFEVSNKVEYKLQFHYIQGKKTEEICYDTKHKKVWNCRYYYDQDSNLTEKHYYKNGHLFYKIIITYSGNNEKQEMKKLLHTDFLKTFDWTDAGKLMLCLYVV